MTTMRLRRLAGILLKIAVTCALFAWLSRSIDGSALWRSLSALSPGAIALALALIVAQSLLLGWRWHRIIRWLDGRLAPALAIRWTFVGLFFNQALPSSVGGDAVRIWLLHRYGARQGLPFASVAIERLTGVTLLALMISTSVLWMGPVSTDPAVRAALLVVGPALLTLLVTVAVLGKPSHATSRSPWALRSAVSATDCEESLDLRLHCWRSSASAWLQT
jgi:glycosyltransferase 2 family protein